MNKPRTEITERRKRDYCTTLAQRRLVSGLLRDGYDEATSMYKDKDFSISLFTADLPNSLTQPNRNYFSYEHAKQEMNTLFGHIAVNATVEIEKDNGHYIISLLRQVPDTQEG